MISARFRVGSRHKKRLARANKRAHNNAHEHDEHGDREGVHRLGWGGLDAGGGRVVTPAQANRLSADELTKLIQSVFGTDFYASAWKGNRQIAKRVSALGVETVRAKTWIEAIALAKAKWGW
jgi:hypothetical protein